MQIYVFTVEDTFFKLNHGVFIVCLNDQAQTFMALVVLLMIF